MLFYPFILYMQKHNGYWDSEPCYTLEEAENMIDNLNEEDYWWYVLVSKSVARGDETIKGGEVHSKSRGKTRVRKK